MSCRKDWMFSRIHNLYWQIRFTRNASVKRKYYRYVSAEKKRLEKLGVCSEEVRLLCRHLSNLSNVHAERRLLEHRGGTWRYS